MVRFVPRQRKHKVLARQRAATDSTAVNDDANAVEIVPPSKQEREAKKQKLQDELRAQQPKMSAKKQKRLDKYIENKLKKDENFELVRKLEKEKDKWDSRGLKSSKVLRKRGFDDFVSGQTDSPLHHEVIEVKRSAKKSTDDRDLYNGTTDHKDGSDTASENSFEMQHQGLFNGEATLESDDAWVSKRAPPVQGTGLANPLQTGSDGLPIIPIRASKKKRRVTKDKEAELTRGVVAEESPWEGFDSELDEESPDSLDEDEDQMDYSSEDISAEDSDISENNSSVEEENDEEGASDTSSSDPSQANKIIKPRASAFKAWATQQLNQAIGHTPSYAANGDGELPTHDSAQSKSTQTNSIPQDPVRLVNGLPEVKNPTVDRQIYSVQVQRPIAAQESRRHLPIVQREQEIMEAIHANPVVVVKGETGSGKTTQLPQFLYEAGYSDPKSSTPGMIGITQPRRVAAVSMAKRVGEELGDYGGRVAHQIRFDSSVSSHTAIKFMTDGILLRELSQDLLLRKYSAIIIDEAHERSVNTDILIGMLSKIVPARMRKDKFNPDPKPLKLIIMSATLNVEDFLHSKLFAPNLRPPIVEAEGRQYRVTTHFALRSRADYLEETIEKVKRAHRKLPKGGMLVFLTGQMEIKQVMSRLRKELAQATTQTSAVVVASKMHVTASETPLEVDDVDFGVVRKRHGDDDEQDEVDILTPSDEEAEDREFEISDNEEDDDDNNEDNDSDDLNEVKRKNRPSKLDGPNLGSNSRRDPYDTVHILPLYSQLPTQEQLRVFHPPPPRARLIVLATNVAETSLTIPGIRYVFDSGRSKERHYNLETGVQSFEVDYISKASAAQRAGRAGRTGPGGHCWRLYTSAVYERFFPEHAVPEILRVPAENVVLQLKGFAYPKPVSDFPFPTPPAPEALSRAEILLRNLGALDDANSSSSTGSGKVTALGRQLSNFPLPPRLGKILVSALETENPDILGAAIDLVAGLAVGDIYHISNEGGDTSDVNVDIDENEQKQKYGRAQAVLSRHDGSSDAWKLLTAVSMYVHHGTATATEDHEEFCVRYYLKSKPMREIGQLVRQLRGIVAANYPGVKIGDNDGNKISSSSRNSKQILPTALVKGVGTVAASGFVDQVAIRWDCAPNPPSLATKPRRAIDVPYLPLTPLPLPPAAAAAIDLVESRAVFIHPSSVLARLPPKALPTYIVYTHLQQSQPHTIGGQNTVNSKTRMHPLTPIDAASLVRLATTAAAHDTSSSSSSALLRYGKPVPKMPIEDVTGVPVNTTGVGTAARKRRVCWVSVELRASSAATGWPLPAVKVRQVIDMKSPSGWRVEEVLY